MTREVGRSIAEGDQALPDSIRSYFEPRFGYDFSHVRVHTGRTAEQVANSLNASAYTLSNHIVFGARQYAPDSTVGRRLLAHELAHVVQQSHGGVPRIQRYRVTQLQPRRHRYQSDTRARFFFEFDSSELNPTVPDEAAERQRVVNWALAHNGAHVNLAGQAGQEGNQGYNQRLARARADTIAELLRDNGVIVDSITTDLDYQDRMVEHRFHRSVVVTMVGTPGGCTNFTQDQRDADQTTCESVFDSTYARCLGIMNEATRRLGLANDQARDLLLQSYFSGESLTDIRSDVVDIAFRLIEVADDNTGHVCHARCGQGCNRPASAAANGPVNLCPQFYLTNVPGPLGAHRRVHALLHETVHSAGQGIDVSYADGRLFPVLEGRDARQNADSYVSFIVLLAGTTEQAHLVVATLGSPPADAYRFTTDAGTPDVTCNTNARRAIGYSEAWLNYAAFWSAGLYDWIHASLAGWDSTGNGRHAMMEIFCPLFALGHPGLTTTPRLNANVRAVVTNFHTDIAGRGFTVPPTTSRATTRDRTRVAGVYDRLYRMYRSLRQDLTVGEAAGGDGTWPSAPGLPGIGATVALPTAFFKWSRLDQTRHIVRLLARAALPDVEEPLVESYVEAAEGTRRLRGLGPA
ncbi:MAG: DUF4157 domain-containing protein [bacterium]|nr:DUF4157 domain-containing protein [bacterium]